MLTYLHGDQLGSVSVITDASGTMASKQEYGPWGNVRSGGASGTSLNYTGQRLDNTGLLFYNARYYDPAIGRFISADTIVPGSGPLTVSPSDATASEMWRKSGGGTGNPQELNRYSYVNNNPINATDPTGHFLDTILDVAFIAYDIYDIAANGYTAEKGLALAADVGGALIPGLTGAGAMVRAAAHADDVVGAVKVASSTADAVKAACSFPADTPVLTHDGAVAISDIAVGQQVVAWDEASGTTGTYTVTASWAHLDPVIIVLTLDGERLQATPEHPFYVCR